MKSSAAKATGCAAFIFLVASFCLVHSGCSRPLSRSKIGKAPATINIPLANEKIVVDGVLDENCYTANDSFQKFVVANSPDTNVPKTEFWLFWSDDRLVFASRCVDQSPAADEPKEDEHNVDGQDRVELFLWSGNPEDSYYCLEIAPEGAVHDYKAKFYREFDDEWSPQGEWSAKAKKSANGYTTEVVLPKEAMEAMGFELKGGGELRVGLFRADFDKFNGTPTWITWVDHGNEPDFHVAESFGAALLDSTDGTVNNDVAAPAALPQDSVPDTEHVVYVSGSTHGIGVGQSVQLDATSNKGREQFEWSIEEKQVASISAEGKVSGLKPGTTLIIAKSKTDGQEGIFLLTVAGTRGKNETIEGSPNEPFSNKGILLFPADIDSVPEWPRIAKEAGLNCIGIHPGGGHLENIVADFRKWISGPKGKQFLSNCEQQGINVEYEIHAVKELLPRSLFDKDPSMFRAGNGRRHREGNLCVHSRPALETLAKNVVGLSRTAKPTTGRYYFWPDDGRPMCRCFACQNYTDSEQTLIMELYLQKELSKIDAKATVAHLAYSNTIDPPKKILPGDKVFLEFAAISRSYDEPYRQQRDHKQGWRKLEANLKVFQPDTAQVLEYWVDVSKWSNWKRPFKQLPWDEKIAKVVGDDVEFYRSLGIPHITSFGNGLDAYYEKQFGIQSVLTEYGKHLNAANSTNKN